MKKKGMLMGLLVVVFFIGFISFQTQIANEKNIKEATKELFPKSIQTKDVTGEFKKEYVKKNFPAIEKIFACQDKEGNDLGKVFVVDPVGYKGTIKIAVGIDEQRKETIGIKILSHGETDEYGGPVTEKWFLDRFKGKNVLRFLNLVKLDSIDSQDIVQITGATVTSKGVVNGVNAAIGAFNYIDTKREMSAVAKRVSKELWTDETETFFINGGKKGKIQISMDELKKLPTVKSKCILKKSTGTEIEMTAEGPTLDAVLKHFGDELSTYKGMGITGRDGYYALVSKDILDQRKIILAYKIDGKPISEEEKPIRIVIPEEMGVYWVKLVGSIDLYEDIAKKDIQSIKMFDPLTKDIKPYMYEYYGSKDESIEIGKILRELENVNPKGFFTMVSSDGLIKNETIAIVLQRYYIKTTGKNAPMNIAPNFKLGMNVKNMAYFSTTEDVVIFPQEMMKLTQMKKIQGYEGMPLDEIMSNVGLMDMDQKSFELVGADGQKINISGEKANECILNYKDKTVTAMWNTKDGVKILEDLLEVNEIRGDE